MGSKVKGSLILQNISKGMSSLQKRRVNLFYSQVGRNKLFLHELNKGTLVYCQTEGQGPPGKPFSMIIITASQRNSFQHGVRIGFFPATQGIFPMQRLKQHLLHWQVGSLPSHQGSCRGSFSMAKWSAVLCYCRIPYTGYGIAIP